MSLRVFRFRNMPSGALKNEWKRLVKMGISLERRAQESTSTIDVRISASLSSPGRPDFSNSPICLMSVRSMRCSHCLMSFEADSSPSSTFPRSMSGSSPLILDKIFSGTPEDLSVSTIPCASTASRSKRSLRRSIHVANGSAPHGFSSKASWGRSISPVTMSRLISSLENGSPNKSWAKEATFGFSSGDPIVAEVA